MCATWNEWGRNKARNRGFHCSMWRLSIQPRDGLAFCNNIVHFGCVQPLRMCIVKFSTPWHYKYLIYNTTDPPCERWVSTLKSFSNEFFSRVGHPSTFTSCRDDNATVFVASRMRCYELSVSRFHIKEKLSIWSSFVKEGLFARFVSHRFYNYEYLLE